MKIKKLNSLLLAALLTITSSGNCFAMISDSDSGSESDSSLSDIVVPELISNGGLEEQVRLDAQRAQQLLEQLDRSDDKIAKLRAIHTRNQGELDRINQMLCDVIRERDDLKLQLEATKENLQRYVNRTNPPHPYPILKDKRFYGGATAGGILVAAIATIGISVYARVTHTHSNHK